MKAVVNSVNFLLLDLRAVIDGQGKGMQIWDGLWGGFWARIFFLVFLVCWERRWISFCCRERFRGRILILTLCPCLDGEGDPGAAHPSPGAGEGQWVVQGLLQPLHHLPQNQDAQRQPTQEWPGGALLPQPLLHQPPPPGNALKFLSNNHCCTLANRELGQQGFRVALRELWPPEKSPGSTHKN